MPLAAAALDTRAARRLTAAVMAAALQGLFYWLVVHEAVEPTAAPISKPLEVTIFEMARQIPKAAFPRKRRQVNTSGSIVAKKALTPEEPPIEQPITVTETVKPAPRGPIDWRRAMRAEMRMEDARSRANRLQFGFPREPASVPALPQFGWDYARTHRVQPLPGGGMLINLNDRCALVVYALFIPVCKIGRIPVNGALFKHIHDAQNDRPNGLP